MKLASDVRLERDRMLLHVLPQDFTLDGRAGFRKPQKGVCSRLEANVHIVTASYPGTSGAGRRGALAHLAVEETVFEPMAAAYACLYPEDARAASRCSTWACIRPTWWSTTATRCCSPPAFPCGPIT